MPLPSLRRTAAALVHVASACVAISHPAAHAQTLPPPPVSPMPLERYEYDAMGRRTKIIRGAGTLNLETRFRHDTLGRVIETTDPRNGTTGIGYDGGDRPIQVTDPRGLVTQHPRNGFGDVQRRISPDSGTDRLTYDAARNLKTRTDSRGVLTTYGYDASDRLTSAEYAKEGHSSEAVSLAYSQRGPDFSFGGGRLTSTAFPGGWNRYAYDEQGMIARDLQHLEASAGSNPSPLDQVVVYGETLGNLSSITYPSGRRLTMTWVDGEITAMALARSSDATATPLFTQIGWTPFAGSLKRWTAHMANGTLTNQRFFDLAGRMTRHTFGDVFRDIHYDAANRIVGFTHLAPDGTPQPALDQSFGYDENSRITRITTNAATWTISHDPNGNRSSVSLNGSPSLYTTEATSNRLTAISNPARSFAHDPAGNTTSESAGYTATFNLRGQLATITKAGVTTHYTYNAGGQRVRKVSSTGPASTTLFVYDPQGHLLGEYDRNGATLREYVWLRDTPMAMFIPDPTDPTGEPLVYFIHTDHLNAPRIVVDRDNRLRWRWLAEPFGATAPEGDPQGLGVFTQNLRFPGQYADAESGLFYNHHRTYDPSRGGYPQSDPIGLAGGSMSTYTYVEGNPLTGIDPDGTNAVWALYRAGGMGWKLGEEINPLIQPYIAAGLDSLLLPDPMEEAVVLAQNNKQTRKRIDGLEKQIEVHKKKIDQEPECDAANHWREEVKIWESEIQRLRLRLPNGR
jgi:RHS repeat-associated protein